MSIVAVRRQLRILVVEDEPDAWLAIGELLKQVEEFECIPEWAATHEAAVQALDASDVDLCLLDTHLGEHEGLALLKHAVQIGCRFPILLLSGEDSVEVAVAAMQAGASNCLLKRGLSRESLTRALTAAVAAAPSTGDAARFPSFLGEGAQLFEYRIERVLGNGGFGITYLARDTLLDASVAIKEYLPSEVAYRASPTRVAVRSPGDHNTFHWGLKQFLKEARTLARFSHPNLVRVLRFFEANATAYFVMEYAQGETFGSVLKRERTLPEARIRALLDPLLDALASVHAAGILHRDIKPDNVILAADGRPILIDFGAARIQLGRKTESVIATFSAGYTPIEQYSSSGEQGPWTDIYAVGGLLYRCIAGHRPPDAPDRVRLDEMAPASRVGEGRYSPGFLKAVDWALGVHAAERPQSIAAWRSQLEEKTRVAAPTDVASSVATIPTGRPAARARVKWAWGAGAVAALVAGALALQFGIKTATPEHVEAAVAPQTVVPSTSESAVEEKKTPVAARAAKASAPRKAVADMAPLSSFRDCPTCPVMLVIPAGTFSMGAEDDKAADWEGPVHSVTFASPYAIGRFEVTAGQWMECASEGGCPARNTKTANLPAVRVNWHEAQSYAAWLSRHTGRTYRLPTEAAWEYAARSGTDYATFWGDKPELQCSYANGADAAVKARLAAGAAVATCDDKHAKRAAVGSFRPNYYGLYDVLGNVWEWTQDCWHKNYDDAPSDGSAMSEGTCARRVARGGSWRTSPDALRATSRGAYEPTEQADTIGFRVAAY